MINNVSHSSQTLKFRVSLPFWRSMAEHVLWFAVALGLVIYCVLMSALVLQIKMQSSSWAQWSRVWEVAVDGMWIKFLLITCRVSSIWVRFFALLSDNFALYVTKNVAMRLGDNFEIPAVENQCNCMQDVQWSVTECNEVLTCKSCKLMWD